VPADTISPMDLPANTDRYRTYPAHERPDVLVTLDDGDECEGELRAWNGLAMAVGLAPSSGVVDRDKAHAPATSLLTGSEQTSATSRRQGGHLHGRTAAVQISSGRVRRVPDLGCRPAGPAKAAAKARASGSARSSRRHQGHTSPELSLETRLGSCTVPR
jgi:hypothetical protein